MPDLSDYIGTWEGTWLTFLVPDELHDESPLRATIDRDHGGFVIEYGGSIEGAEVAGRLRWSEGGGRTTVDWIDSWHTGGKDERLEGFGDAPRPTGTVATIRGRGTSRSRPPTPASR